METFENDTGYAGSLGFGQHPALLVVDMIQAYTLPDSPFYAPGYVEVARQTIHLLALARQYSLPIAFTNLHYDARHYTGGHFLRKIPALRLLTTQPELNEWIEGLEPLPQEPVFSKQYASAFIGTSLQAYLSFIRADMLLICGVSTSGCIRATATDAIQHGYIPGIVTDAVGDRKPEINQTNLFDLQAKYADLYTTEQVAYHLQRRVTEGPPNPSN